MSAKPLLVQFTLTDCAFCSVALKKCRISFKLKESLLFTSLHLFKDTVMA